MLGFANSIRARLSGKGVRKLQTATEPRLDELNAHSLSRPLGLRNAVGFDCSVHEHRSSQWNRIRARSAASRTSRTLCVLAVLTSGLALPAVIGLPASPAAAQGLTWSAPTTIDTPSTTPKDLTSVSCPSASLCAAVDQNGNVLTFNGTSWSAPSDADGSRDLTSVSCTTASFCMAVDTASNALTYNGTSWSSTSGTGSSLYSVSCASSSFCIAVDSTGKALTYDGSSWSSGVSIDSGHAADAVSCPSTSFCVATDTAGHAITYSSGSWAAPTDVDGSNQIDSISCPTNSFCVAVDAAGNAINYSSGSWSSPADIDGSQTLTSVSCTSSSSCRAVDGLGRVVSYNGSSWSAPASIDASSITEAVSLSSVSCATTTFCAAVDTVGKAFTYNGTSWSAGTSIDGSGFTSVSCPTSSFCAAVDSAGRALTYNGSSWSNPSDIDGAIYLAWVSCATSSFCIAVDDGGKAFTYNGTSWSAGTSIDTSGLASVSCPSSSFCAAVDESGNALVYNGSSWSSRTNVDGSNYLSSVSCPSGSFCAAVDESGNALVYSGSSWSSVSDVDSSNYLTSVSCPTSSFCVAVDKGGNAITYNGTSWSSASTADSGTYLASVSCASSTFCVTTGTGYPVDANAATYNGSAWSSNFTLDGSNNPASISCPSSSFCALVDQENGVVYGTPPNAVLSAVGIASGDSAVHNPTCNRGQPVNCASGDFWHSFTDVKVPGRGPFLDLTRTYNSLSASTTGIFGFGWSSSYEAHLTVNGDGSVTITEGDGSSVTAEPSGGSYSVPSWADSSLAQNHDGTWTFIRQATSTYTFNSNGKLTAIKDLNGYSTTLTYQSGQLTTVTDPGGRTISFSYGSNGLVSKVTDPAEDSITYAYDSSNNLTSVTDSINRKTSFTYDSNHLLLTMTSPNNGVLTNVYDSSARVTKQTDAAGLVTTFAYTGNNFSSSGGTTTITDPHGNVETEQYQNGELTSLTKGAGTSSAATWTYGYDANTFGQTSVTDPNSHQTTSTYDSNGNLLTRTDANNKKTTYTYNSFNEPLSVTDPVGIVTDYTYDSNGNLTSKVVHGTGGQTLTTSYTVCETGCPSGYTTGDVESVTDPNGNTTTYTYDAYGDRTSTTSPSIGQTSSTNSRDRFSFDSPSIAAVGSLASQNGANVNAISVSPQHLGDAMVVSVGITTSSVSVSTIWGGGSSSWTKLESISDPTNGRDDELWLGTVTSTGSTTLYASYSADLNNAYVDLSAQEFSSGFGQNTTWALDNASTASATSSSGTVDFPSLTPAQSHELYVGYSHVTNSASAGTTPGFSYGITVGGNALAYDGNVSVAASPTASQSPNGTYDSVGALLTASPVPIQPVGSLASLYGANVNAISMSPQHVGDALVLSITIDTASVSVNSISGGGSSWTKLESATDSNDDREVELWLGTVNSTGSSTIYMNYSGDTNGAYVDLSVQEFSAGLGQNTHWSADKASSASTTSSTSTISLPSLTPSGSNELYVGYAWLPQYVTTGSTAGVSYPITAAGNLFAYDGDVSSAIAPTAIQSPDGDYQAVGALITASPSAISSVGSLSSNGGTNLASLSVSPQANGDALLLAVAIDNPSVSVSSVSGGGSSWTKLETITDSTNNRDDELWLGTVTSTGSSSISVTFSATPNSWVELSSEEFTAGLGSNTVWSKDSAANSSSTTNTTALSYPSLAASGSLELYLGFTELENVASSGTSAGFTYQTTSSNNQIAYDTDVSGSVAPTASQSPAGNFDSVGALLTANLADSAPIVEGVFPTGGSSVGGTSVSIVGQNLSSVNGVFFGAASAQSYRVNGATSLTTTSPAGSSGTVDVTVTTPSGGSGGLTQDVYDAMGRKVCEASANATSSGTDCPPAGQPRVAGTSTWVYDNDGEVTSQTDANGHTTSYGYDSDGNKTSSTDALNNETVTSYDKDDRVSSVTQGYGSSSTSTTSYTYDIVPSNCPSPPSGTTYCAQVKNGLSNTTTSYYDALDHVIEQAPPNTTAQTPTTYTYDGVGNVLTKIDGSGTTTYTYDGDNRPSTVTYSNTQPGFVQPHGVTYSYDADGNRNQMVDGTGTTTYSYDGFERVISVTNGANATLTYGYDSDGNLTCLSYPNSGTKNCQNSNSGTGIVTYKYDAADLMTQMTDWFGNSTSFSYDSDFNLTNTALPSASASAVTNSYDQTDALIDTSVTAGGTKSDLTSLTRNADEQIATSDTSGSNTSYAYDPLSRVTTGSTASYSYDGASEIASVTSSGSTTDYSYNTDGQLCWSGSSTGSCSSPPSGATTYVENTVGERTSATPSGGHSTSFGWNQAGQLTCETAANGSSYSCANQNSSYSSTYSYNGDGIRMSDTPAGGTSQQFTWDTRTSLPRLLEDGTNYYLYGSNSSPAPIEQISIAGSSPTYLVSDTTGVREQLSASGSTVGAMSFDTYGNPCTSCTIGTPFGFEGGYTDNTGFVYLINRYYDPASGQFLSVDPDVTTTGQAYAYAGDDPANGSDPTGTSPFTKVNWGGAQYGYTQCSTGAPCIYVLTSVYDYFQYLSPNLYTSIGAAAIVFSNVTALYSHSSNSAIASACQTVNSCITNVLVPGLIDWQSVGPDPLYLSADNTVVWVAY